MHSSVSVIVSPRLLSLPPQQGQVVGDGSTTRSRGRCDGSGARTGLARVNARTAVAAGCAWAAATASSVMAVSISSSCISNWSSSLRPRSAEASKRSRLCRAIISFRCVTIASAPAARASHSRRAARSASNAAFSASMSSGSVSVASLTPESNHTPPLSCTPKCRPASSHPSHPASSGRQVRCGCRQSIPSNM